MNKALFLLLAVLTGVALYVYLDPSLNRQASQQIDEVLGSDQSRTLYRWRDAEGQWQLSDTPPKADIPYETVQYHQDTNVVPAESLTGKSTPPR